MRNCYYAHDVNPNLHNSPGSLTEAALEPVVTTAAQKKATAETGLNLRRSFGLLTDQANLLVPLFHVADLYSRSLVAGPFVFRPDGFLLIDQQLSLQVDGLVIDQDRQDYGNLALRPCAVIEVIPVVTGARAPPELPTNRNHENSMSAWL